MKDLLSLINKLCNPAKLYLVLSVISVIFYVFSMNEVNNIIVKADPNISNEAELNKNLLDKIQENLNWEQSV